MEIKEARERTKNFARLMRNQENQEYFKFVDAILTKLEDGLMIEPPCKPGQIVFRIVNGAEPHITRDRCEEFMLDGLGWQCRLVSHIVDITEFGKTLFLTREEAERTRQRQAADINPIINKALDPYKP